MTGKIYVAGCGRMGLGMCRALVEQGFDATGFDIRPADDFGEFARHMTFDAAAMRAEAETLFTVVRDIDETEALLFTDQRAVEAKRLRTLIVSSTLSPRYSKALAGRIPDHITLIDAPMSGAQIAADERRLSFMLGGPDEALDRLAPLFDAMGTKIHRMGPFGAGMTAKVLNNYVAVATAAANRQAYDWAKTLDLDPKRLRALMHDSSGQTWFGTNFDDIEFARDGYDPKNTIGTLAKDMAAALHGADAEDNAVGQAIIAYLKTLKPYRD